MNILKSMLNDFNKSLNNFINTYSTITPWTNVYGLSRSIIALGLLLTLLLTNYNYLFPKINGVFVKPHMFFYEKISVFYLFQDNLIIAIGLSIIILFLVILGYFPQVTGVLHWWITYSYMISSVLIEGGDQIASIVTLLLIPICITDNRKNHWYKNDDSNSKSRLKLFIWSFYFIISLQISIIYFHAGIEKMKVEEWINGTATYYWFTHGIFGVTSSLRGDVSVLFSNIYVSTLFTWGTIIFEILLATWLFVKPNKWNWKLMFILLLFFHFGIAWIHGLISFMLTMVGCGIIYFFPKNKQLNLII